MFPVGRSLTPPPPAFKVLTDEDKPNEDTQRWVTDTPPSPPLPSVPQSARVGLD